MTRTTTGQTTTGANGQVLSISGLTVGLTSGVPIIEGVDLSVAPGQILGLVGESGSGKSTLGLAMLGFARAGARITAGEVRVGAESMLQRPERELRRLRGRLVSYVPQDPASALNPSRRIRDQLGDRLVDSPRGERKALIRRALERAQLPTTDKFLARFPHQLSGGQQQRALIAMALVQEPLLLVLDEPTTGLDVITQEALLSEMLRLRDELGISLVYVTHDLAAVASVADAVAVMYAGRIIEQGSLQQVLQKPVHPYTVGLMESIPDHMRPARLRGLPGVAVGVGQWPPGCSFEPRCAQAQPHCRLEMPALETVSNGHMVRCFQWRATPEAKRLENVRAEASWAADAVLTVEHLRAVHGRGVEQVVAADDVSFSISPGEWVALVGESGSGKTTVARCIAGLHPPAAGGIHLHGKPLAAYAHDRNRDELRRLQFIPQNPYESLNPRHRVGAILGHAAMVLRGLTRDEARSESARVIEEVRLPAATLLRYPGELSGGERQRVAVARALVAEPDVLICDEITSALDVSVQAAVLDLLNNLQSEHGLSVLFITHDLGVVASTADTVLVLKHGVVCESGAVHDLLASPSDDYTQQLLSAAPRLELMADGGLVEG